jgi:hypothetical protein
VLVCRRETRQDSVLECMHGALRYLIEGLSCYSTRLIGSPCDLLLVSFVMLYLVKSTMASTTGQPTSIAAREIIRSALLIRQSERLTQVSDLHRDK